MRKCDVDHGSRSQINGEHFTKVSFSKLTNRFHGRDGEPVGDIFLRAPNASKWFPFRMEVSHARTGATSRVSSGALISKKKIDQSSAQVFMALTSARHGEGGSSQRPPLVIITVAAPQRNVGPAPWYGSSYSPITVISPTRHGEGGTPPGRGTVDGTVDGTARDMKNKVKPWALLHFITHAI